MKIDLTTPKQTNEFSTSWLGHAVLDAAGDELFEHLNDKERYVDVTMTVNGKNVNPKSFFDHLGEQYDKQVERAARELIQDKFYDVTSLLGDLQEKAKELDIKLIEKIGW